jgi:hypothetical protein
VYNEIDKLIDHVAGITAAIIVLVGHFAVTLKIDALLSFSK